MTSVSKILSKSDERLNLFLLPRAMSKKKPKTILLKRDYWLITNKKAMSLHLKDMKLCKQQLAVARGNVWLQKKHYLSN